MAFPGYLPSLYWSPYWILSRATYHSAPRYGGVRTWVEGLLARGKCELTLHVTFEEHNCLMLTLTIYYTIRKPMVGRNNMHAASYMSVITILRAISAIHERNALRVVFWQQIGKFLLKSITALSMTPVVYHTIIWIWCLLYVDLSLLADVQYRILPIKAASHKARWNKYFRFFFKFYLSFLSV